MKRSGVSLLLFYFLRRMTEPIRFYRDDKNFVSLILNRPERSNALSLDLLRRFSEYLDEIRDDSRYGVLLLRAEGKNFCGGLDLKEATQSDENARLMPTLVVEILAKLRRLPQVVVTEAQGAARAGGGALIAASDLVVATEDFNIAFPEVRRGLEPMLLFPLLRRKLSTSALSELLLTGDPVNAQRALQLGLVHRIVQRSVGGALEEGYVSDILNADPKAVRTAKEMILVHENAAAGCSLEEEFAQSLENHLASWCSPSGREGVAAFLEKREPNFR